MRISLIIILGLIHINLFSQIQLEIDGFSDKYKGVLTIEKGFEDEVFKKGNISIVQKVTNDRLIDIDSDELTFDIDENGNVKTNVLEIPYGEQSIIIYEDFNFDGIKDLAVMDGQHSCYHGPSFQIYLEIDNKLVFSSEFTSLAQEYCGMFQVDYKTKTIHTMTKSGCCWHQFSEFKVVDNILKPIHIVEENAMAFPFHTTKITKWTDEKEIVKIKKTIDLQNEGIKVLYSFNLVKNNKKVIVFNINDRTLNYALIRKDGTVEFSYPLETIYKKPDFKISSYNDQLTFKNENAIYKIYQKQNGERINAIGIKVHVDNKLYDLKGDLSSLKGNLKNINKVKLDNVIYE